MAVIREAPKCPFCGKQTAEAIYKDEQHLPASQRIYGDTFIGWESIPCDCKEQDTFLQIAYNKFLDLRKQAVSVKDTSKDTISKRTEGFLDWSVPLLKEFEALLEKEKQQRIKNHWMK